MTPPLPSEAAMLLHRVSKETSGMREGEICSPLQIFDMWRECMEMRTKLGESLRTQFSVKEKARLTRIIKEDEMFRNIRTGELKKTIADAQGDVRLSIVEEKEKEIDAAADFLLYQEMKDSLERCMSYLNSLQSFIRSQEQRGNS